MIAEIVPADVYRQVKTLQNIIYLLCAVQIISTVIILTAKYIQYKKTKLLYTRTDALLSLNEKHGLYQDSQQVVATEKLKEVQSTVVTVDQKIATVDRKVDVLPDEVVKKLNDHSTAESGLQLRKGNGQ